MRTLCKYRLLLVFLLDCRCDGQNAIFYNAGRSKFLGLKFESSQIRIYHTCSISLIPREQERGKRTATHSPLFLLALFLLHTLPPSPPLNMGTHFEKLYWMGGGVGRCMENKPGGMSWRSAAGHGLCPSLLWTSFLPLPSWSPWLRRVLSLPKVISNPRISFQDLKCPLPSTGSGKPHARVADL